ARWRSGCRLPSARSTARSQRMLARGSRCRRDSASGRSGGCGVSCAGSTAATISPPTSAGSRPPRWRLSQLAPRSWRREMGDAPEARGLDVLLRGLSMVRSDHQALELSRPLYDGLYEYLKRAALLGREPA